MMLKWSYDLISFRSIYMTGNVDNAVTDNLPMLIGPANYIILIITLLYTFFYFLKRKKINAHKYIKRTKKKAIIYTLVFFLFGQCIIQYHWHKELTSRGTPANILNFPPRLIRHDALRIADYVSKGYPIYVVTSLLHMFERRSLSAQQINQINNYLDSQTNEINPVYDFSQNAEKNLIIILVESLDAHAIKAISNGSEIMPNLYALSKSSGSISALNVVSQIKDGSSGDGQLLLNTGLLPLQEGSASMEYGVCTSFISLTDIFKSRPTEAIFGERGACWDIKNVYSAWGFSPIITAKEINNSNYIDDQELLSYTPLIAKSIKQPFFMELVTTSMHTPFNMVDEPMPEWIANSEYSEIRKKYYHTCNFFDRALGKFIERLKEQGIWDDTVLVVVSDHSMKTDETGEDAQFFNIPMAFIAANTGVTAKIDHTVGQVDLFPTIIDIMGMTDSKNGEYTINGKPLYWRGLGQSILSPNHPGGAADYTGHIHGDVNTKDAVRLREAFEVSHNIIRGNYLNGKIE